MKEFYLRIADRLAKAVPGLRLIDLDKGQTDNPETRQGVDYPAALIDIEFPSCEDTGGRNQQCRATITIRVADLAITDETSYSTPHMWRERSLAILDTVQAVVQALQGFDCGFSSSLSRTTQQAERRDDVLKVYRITFTATFDEEVDE